jgi:RNA-binding protein 39
MQNLNGLELAGRAIKVAPVAEGAGAGDGAGEIDDDDGGGLALNARSRALLMQKLDRTGMAAVVPPPAPLAGVPLAQIPHAQKPIGLPSQYLLLENMFDPLKETEPDWDLDIADDTKEECSKYGAVKHIYVDKNSQGHVYLKFDATPSAQNAQKALHGRWFAGKQISATFMVPLNYVTRFPEAVNA